MKKKFRLEKSIEKFNDKLDQARKLAALDARADPLLSLAKGASAKLIRMDEFIRQGYQFGTKEERIEALFWIGQLIESTPTADGFSGLWFLNALNQWDGNEPMDLLRAMGLIEPGRGRVVDRFALARRMIDLVGSGMTMAEASRICAPEFKCSPETALHWYRRRKELFK